jgi:hypothetical protein
VHELLAADSPYLPKRGTHNAALAHRRSDKRSPLTDQVLRDAIAERAELYLDELQQLLRERANVEVSVSTVCRWLQLLKLPRKRASRVALARVSERVQQLRDNFASNVQPRLPSAVGRLICVDESHVDERSAQRRYARAPPGEPAMVAQPYNGGAARGNRITLLSAVTVVRDAHTGKLKTLLALHLHTGSSCNREVFARFIRDKVAPMAEEMRAHNDALCLWSGDDDDSDDGGASDDGAAVQPAGASVQREDESDSDDDSFVDHSASASAAPAAPSSSSRPGRIRRPAQRDTNFVYDDSDHPTNSPPVANAPRKPRQPKKAPARKRTSKRLSKKPTAAARQQVFKRARAIYLLMDNWSGHRGDQVLDACGIHVSRQFIPPYSPDFNLPIEALFGDTKSWLRRHHYWGQPALTTQVIERAVREAATVSAVLARFKRAGYAVSDAELAEARAQEGCA